MIASLRWLNDFLERELSATRVRDILTTRAATVEAVAPVREDLAQIVIGRVVHAERHPEAEKLWLTRVDVGAGEPVQVVCGAPNVEVGRAYPFAPVGATLPGGVRLERRKIRGQLSNGMLCSARELGLGDDHAGILALDTDASPGSSFLAATGAGDVRFEIDVLPNRPDLLSHEGLARELAAAEGMRLRPVEIPGVGGEQANPRTAERSGTVGGVQVAIEDSEGCSRYVATVIRGVTIRPSPSWLTERLQAVGSRPINNVVDATNYMLHAFGQPMHAFDLQKLGDSVVVRRANRGEKLVTLDGAERTLSPEMTVIAGPVRAEAVAGVIGGAGSEVTDDTTDILLETALFSPSGVRATRRALGVSTDASYRFERHVDAARVGERAAFAARLIVAVAGGRIVEQPLEVSSAARAEPPAVELRTSRVARVLGVPISTEEIGTLLTSVGFGVSGGGEALKVAAPPWRGDAVAEIDLIEEVARLRGYDTFPSEVRPFRPTSVPDDPAWGLERRVRAALVGCGLYEIRPMPFVAGTGGESLRLRNPLAENEAHLRTSLLPTLASRAEHNLSQMSRSVRLFEIGTVFLSSEGARPQERLRAGALLMGYSEPPHFTNAHPRAYDPWDIKWIAEVIAETAFPHTHLTFNISDLSPSAGVVERTLWIIERGSEKVGEVVLLKLDAPVWASPAFAVEIDLDYARNETSAAAPVTYKALPVTPAADIDLALLVPDSVAAGVVEAAIRRHGGDILESAVLFDEFRGEGIEPGSRSLAWRLTFRHSDRTLRDREIEARKEKLISALMSEFGARPRAS